MYRHAAPETKTSRHYRVRAATVTCEMWRVGSKMERIAGSRWVRWNYCCCSVVLIKCSKQRQQQQQQHQQRPLFGMMPPDKDSPRNSFRAQRFSSWKGKTHREDAARSNMSSSSVRFFTCKFSPTFWRGPKAWTLPYAPPPSRSHPSRGCRRTYPRC